MTNNFPGAMIAQMLYVRNCTQSDLARALGIHKAEVSRMVRTPSLITPKMAAKLAVAFGVNLGYWLDLNRAWLMSQAEALAKEDLGAVPLAVAVEERIARQNEAAKRRIAKHASAS